MQHARACSHAHTLGNPCLPYDEKLFSALYMAATFRDHNKKAHHLFTTTCAFTSDTPCRLFIWDTNNL